MICEENGIFKIAVQNVEQLAYKLRDDCIYCTVNHCPVKELLNELV